MLAGKKKTSDTEIDKIKEFLKSHRTKMTALLQPVNKSQVFFFDKYPALAKRIFVHTEESRADLMA